MIRSSAFQTWLGQRATEYYSKELGTKVTIEKVDVRNLRDMQLKGIYVEDLSGDTLIYAKTINADVKKYSIKKEFVDIEKIELNDGTMKIKALEEGGFNFDFIEEYFASEDEDTTSGGWQVNILNVHLNNTILVYKDEGAEEEITSGFDYNHIRGLVNAHVSDIVQEGDITKLTVHELQVLDKSGFNINKIAGELSILPGGFQIDQMFLQTDNSLLLADKFYLKGRNGSWGDYDDFFNGVKMYSSFKPGSNLSMKDLAFFSEDLVGNPMDLKINGQIRGTVARLKAKDFYLQFEDNSYLKGNFDFDGLPDFENTFMAFNIDELVTSKSDLEKVELPPYDKTEFIELPENLGFLGQFTIDGTFMGYYTDFVAYANVDSDMGELKSDVKFKFSDYHQDFSYTGNLEAVDFNLGTMYADQGLSDFGKVSANVSIDSAFGLEVESMYAELSGMVDYVDLMGYRYKNLKVNSGTFEKDYFIGNLFLNDPNIRMNYDGKVDFSSRIPKYDFDLEVNNAHLYDLFGFALNEGDIDAALCFTLKVDSAQGDDLDNIAGNFELSDFNYHEYGKDINLIDPIAIHTGYKTEKDRILDIKSELFDLNFSGDFKIENLEHSFTDMAHNIMPTLVEASTSKSKRHDYFSYELVVHDVSPISELFDLNLSIYPGTTVKGESDTKYGRFKLDMDSYFIEYDGYTIDTLDVYAESDGEVLDISVKSSKLFIDDGVEFNDLVIALTPSQEYTGLELSWDNGDVNGGQFYGDLFIDSPEKFDFNMFSSQFTALGKNWKIDNNAFIDFNSDTITIEQFNLSHIEENIAESISIDGRISDLLSDGLTIQLSEFQLDNLNSFIGEEDMNYFGEINGGLRLSNLYEEPRFTSDLKIDSFKINKTYVGDIDFVSLWNGAYDDKMMKNITMTGHLIRSEFKTIDFVGKYFPYRSKEILDFEAIFKDTDLGVVNEFLPQDDITEFHAYTNGRVKITGEPDNIKLNGDLTFEEGQFKFVYLNTRYRFDGTIEITENAINFNDIPFYDEETYYLDLPANAMLNGQLKHNNFEDLEYDLDVDFDRLLLMDTDLTQNPEFYGQAYGTGTVNVFGYGEKINISVIAKTEKGTVFNLPLFGADDVVLQDFVRFVTKDSTVEAEDYKVDLEDITMTFGLDITPEAEVRILFDPTIGDMMTGSAIGHLDLDINELGQFKMFGDLEVVKGDYLFTLYNVINKKFLIEPGGTIKWQSGDPYEAVVNLTTNYSTKAPLYNLVALEDEKYEKKVQVNAYMTLKNDLYNPDLSFDIDVPKGDQNVEAALGKLRSDNEDLTKQFFSLMVINNFVSQQQGGYGNAALSATSADLLNNQLSNWLSQMSDEFDIGFNYTPGDALSQQEVALAFGTQLLNDRLEVSGNFGYAQTISQNSTSLIGDFNVEYKINEDGSFRVRGFNETNDFDLTNAAQSRYTQGVGVYYTEEFDKIKDVKLFKKIGNLFKRKNKKDDDVEIGVNGEAIKKEDEEDN